MWDESANGERWTQNGRIDIVPANYYEPLPPAMPAVKFQPHSLTDGVIVPLAQSAITGFLGGLAALAVTAWFKGPIWSVSGTVFALAALVSWLSYRGHWVWQLERILNIDITRDGHKGPPPAQEPINTEPELVRVELVRDDGHQVDWIDFPYPHKLPTLASAVLEGRKYSQSAMVRPGFFERSEYDAIVDVMISRGLARWKNPEAHNIGWEPTYAGKAILRKFLKSHPPTLQGEEGG